MPRETVYILTAILARLIFEALQRYRKLHDGKILPTVLIMDEAHNFIKEHNLNPGTKNASRLCTQIFENIAREGRKFGLGLVLASQRPSELSSTVLAQCNTFLLHRLTNNVDQELVQKLVPDNLRSMLKDLPGLSSRQAILLGFATEIPVLVKMRDLPEELRPKSDDPKYWDSWVNDDPELDWQEIADDWLGLKPD